MKKIDTKKIYLISTVLITSLFSSTAFADCPDKEVDCVNPKTQEVKRIPGTEFKTGTCYKAFFMYGGCDWCDGGEQAAIAQCQKRFGADFNTAHIAR
jgi:hypothetical protein